MRMCQLNLYFIPKTVRSEEVLKIINETFSFNCAENVTDEFSSFSGTTDYNIFCASGMRCNCGSIVSFLQDNDEHKSFEYYVSKNTHQNVQQLEKIKKLLKSSGYKDAFEIHNKRSQEFTDSLSALTKYILDFEIESYEKIKLLPQDRQDAKRRNTYQKISEMHQELEKDNEYQSVLNSYAEYMKENELLSMSSLYSLNKTRTENFSINIDDAIYEAKNNDHNGMREEFHMIKKLLSKLLQICYSVKISAFWQSGDIMHFKKGTTVALDKLSIDDLAFLPYEKLLKVTE